MHMRIIELLRGYILMIILNGNSRLSATWPCTTDTFNNTLRVFCNNKELLSVPQNLDTNMQYLDLSEDKKITELKADSFDKYKKLSWLSLRNSYISTDFGTPYNGFKSLENLEELDISGLRCKCSGKREYKLPPNLKVLKINNTGIGDLIATDLKKLEYVDVSDNPDMVEFPLFDKDAKVHTVILKNVKLDHLVVSQIAPNCHIRKLHLSMDRNGGSELLEPNKYCECNNIFRWVKQFKIESNLLNSAEDLFCRKLDSSKTDAQLCPEDNSYNAALVARKKCLEPPGSFPMWAIYIGGGLILLLIGMILAMVFLDIRMATHIRRAHAALTGRTSGDEEEAQPEDQPAQEDQETPQPEVQKE